MGNTSAKLRKRRISRWEPSKAQVRELARILYEGEDPDSNYAAICRISANAKLHYERQARYALQWMHEKDLEDCSHLL